MIYCNQNGTNKSKVEVSNDSRCVFEQWGELLDKGNRLYSMGLLKKAVEKYKKALELVFTSSENMLMQDGEATLVAINVSCRNISLTYIRQGEYQKSCNVYDKSFRYIREIAEDLNQTPGVRNRASHIMDSIVEDWTECIASSNGELELNTQVFAHNKSHIKHFYH